MTTKEKKPKGPHDRLAEAFRKGRGIRLTAAEVKRLFSDTAIKDACLKTYETQW